MLIFRKANIKTEKVVARIYIRENYIVLRLFLNNISKHSTYISKHSTYISMAPDYIKDVFIGEYGNCKHCKGEQCKFRKNYEINGLKFEKCNGFTFEFNNPTVEKLPDYLNLLREFY